MLECIGYRPVHVRVHLLAEAGSSSIGSPRHRVCWVRADCTPHKSHQTACGFLLDHMWDASQDHLKGRTCRDAVSTPTHILPTVWWYSHSCSGLAFILASSACIFVKGCPQAGRTLHVYRQPESLGTTIGTWNDWRNCFIIIYECPGKLQWSCLSLLMEIVRNCFLRTLSHSTLSMQCWQLHIYNEKVTEAYSQTKFDFRDQNVIGRWMTRTCTFHSLCFHIVRFLKKKKT